MLVTIPSFFCFGVSSIFSQKWRFFFCCRQSPSNPTRWKNSGGFFFCVVLADNRSGWYWGSCSYFVRGFENLFCFALFLLRYLFCKGGGGGVMKREKYCKNYINKTKKVDLKYNSPFVNSVPWYDRLYRGWTHHAVPTSISYYI